MVTQRTRKGPTYRINNVSRNGTIIDQVHTMHKFGYTAFDRVTGKRFIGSFPHRLDRLPCVSLVLNCKMVHIFAFTMCFQWRQWRGQSSVLNKGEFPQTVIDSILKTHAFNQLTFSGRFTNLFPSLSPLSVALTLPLFDSINQLWTFTLSNSDITYPETWNLGSLQEKLADPTLDVSNSTSLSPTKFCHKVDRNTYGRSAKTGLFNQPTAEIIFGCLLSLSRWAEILTGSCFRLGC